MDPKQHVSNHVLPLETNFSTRPLHWKYVVQNRRSLQSLYSPSSGDYALMYVIDRAEGQNLNKFLNRFEKHNYVSNNHKVGQVLKKTD